MYGQIVINETQYHKMEKFSNKFVVIVASYNSRAITIQLSELRAQCCCKQSVTTSQNKYE